jgi:hypothetical protein
MGDYLKIISSFSKSNFLSVLFKLVEFRLTFGIETQQGNNYLIELI